MKQQCSSNEAAMKQQCSSNAAAMQQQCSGNASRCNDSPRLFRLNARGLPMEEY